MYMRFVLYIIVIAYRMRTRVVLSLRVTVECVPLVVPGIFAMIDRPIDRSVVLYAD